MTKIEMTKTKIEMTKIEMTKMHYEIAAYDFIEWYNKNIPHHTEVIDMDYLEMYISSKRSK